MTVARLEAEMPSTELTEWMLVAEIEAEERKQRERDQRVTQGAQARRKRRR